MEENKTITVRTPYTGDKVFLIKDGTRAWIKNPETLEKLGFQLGLETNIEYAELAKYTEVDPIDLKDKENVEPIQVSNNSNNVLNNIVANPILGYREEIKDVSEFDQDSKLFNE